MNAEKIRAELCMPESFEKCVRKAAFRAVKSRPHPLRHRRVMLLAAVILCISGAAAAAFRNWTAGDLFTKEGGFMLPAYAWGSSVDMLREETLLFYEQAGKITYQYENDQLIALDISFERDAQKEGQLRSDLFRQLYQELCALYGTPLEEKNTDEKKAELKRVINEYLGNDSLTEAQRMRRELENAGADEELILRAERAAETSADFIQYIWQDEKTDTALALQQSLHPLTGETLFIRLSLAWRQKK